MLPNNSFLEEEGNPDYDPNRFYPARVGEVLQNYQIVSKLGWGSCSTVWLAKDIKRYVLYFFCSHLVLVIFSWPWQSDRYVALKLTNNSERDRKSAYGELEISQHISRIQSKHQGRSYVRLIQDSFTIRGPVGEHLGLVSEPLREPLWLLGRHLGTIGLDFLHSECHVIHTGKYTVNHFKQGVRSQQI